MDQQSTMPMGQMPVGTVYMAGEDLVVPEPLTADQTPVPTVYITGLGLVEGEPSTATNKDIIEDQLIQDVESGGQACGPELGCQENNANLNQYTSSPAIPPAPETTTKLQVTKSTEFKNSNTHIKEYRSRSRQRGMMVMFSYSEFRTGEEYRDIVSDREMVIDLFSQLNFRPLYYTNLSREETLEAMTKLKPSGYDCLFILVSSHGIKWNGKWDTEFICSSGEGISVHEVIEIFNNLHRPDLAGVPKVFIFQMCRGSKSLCDQSAATDTATTFSEDVTPSAAAARSERWFSDVLIAYSTLPEYESVRNFGDAEGSLYVEALCEVFAAHAHEYHVIDLFRLVDEALRGLDRTATTEVAHWGFGNLYLHPGLFEDADGNATEM